MFWFAATIMGGGAQNSTKTSFHTARDTSPAPPFSRASDRANHRAALLGDEASICAKLITRPAPRSARCRPDEFRGVMLPVVPGGVLGWCGLWGRVVGMETAKFAPLFRVSLVGGGLRGGWLG